MKRMKHLLTVLLVIVLCFSMTACGAGRTNAKWESTTGSATDFEMMDKEEYFYAGDSAAPGAVFDDMKGEVNAQTGSGSSVYRDKDVKLIRRANLTVQTTQFDQAVAALEALVEQLGGYYENADLRSGNYYNQNSNRSGNYTIRVPAGKYDEFMSQVDGIGYLVRKNESSEDVGEAYYDIEARLKTQRTKQARLLDLLEQAKSMEDIISLENALTDVEYLIEQYTSSLNRYDGLVSFATINLSLDEMTKIVEEPGEKASLFTRMKAGVISSVDGLISGFQDLLIWVSYNLIGLVVLAAVVTAGTVVVRRSLKTRKSKKAAPEQKESTGE